MVHTAALEIVAVDVLEDASNTLLLSLVSPWEMQIKHSLGKLEYEIAPVTLIRHELAAGSILMASPTLDDVAELAQLPHHHGDPFDRLLVAQCLRMNVPIVSADQQLDDYDIERIW